MMEECLSLTMALASFFPFGAVFQPDADGDAALLVITGKTAIKGGVDWGSFDV